MSLLLLFQKDEGYGGLQMKPSQTEQTKRMSHLLLPWAGEIVQFFLSVDKKLCMRWYLLYVLVTDSAISMDMLDVRLTLTERKRK